MNTPSIGSFIKRIKSGTADPVRDWFILITVSAIVFAASIVWHIWAFDTVAGGGTLGGKGTASQIPFDRTALTSIHTIFESRATEAAKYQTGVYRYADPSQ